MSLMRNVLWLSLAVSMACSGGKDDSTSTDTDTDADTDTDTDTDSDTDTDTDTDSDTDTDTDTDTGTPTTGCPADLGDTIDYAVDLGVIVDVGSTCGDLSSTGDGGDQDWIVFEVPSTGVWEFVLDWAPDADMDFVLYDSAGERVALLQGDSFYLQPETVYAVLDPGEQYSAQIVASLGFPGDWWVDWRLTTLDPTDDDWMISESSLQTGVYDPVAGSFVGTFTSSYDGLVTGNSLCVWEQQILDWYSDPYSTGADPYAGIPCENSAGEPCTFAVTVTTSYGDPLSGDCSPFYIYQGPPIGLGWHPNADFYGYPVGPSAMYYNPYNGIWIPYALFGFPTSYDESTGVLSVEYTARILYGEL